MAGAIDKVKTAVGAGARANKYKVIINGISGVSINAEQGDLLCKATNFPGATIGQIEVFNQGRKLVIPGDTTYSTTWTVTFYNTEDHKLRKEFIKWMIKADDFDNNIHAANPGDVMTTMKVIQMDAKSNEVVEYEFYNCFVQDIGEISVGDDQTDTLQEFDVTFSFTNWKIVK